MNRSENPSGISVQQRTKTPKSLLTPEALCLVELSGIEPLTSTLPVLELLLATRHSSGDGAIFGRFEEVPHSALKWG